jgi:ubiquinone/menaquinone biosynthesis C-methylase UbiE
MTVSHSAFVGSIPQYYDQYLSPLIFEEYGADLAQRISVPAPGRVLETAAGTGIATRHLRNALPENVHLVVTDLNQPMLAFAKRKFDPHSRTEFQSVNATHLSFSNASFDAVVCQFSLMFFPDKSAAIQEVARVLRPGGVFVFSVWDSYTHNHLIQTVNNTLASLFPNNPPAFFDTPYGYHRIDEVKTLLAETGFGDIEISVLPRTSRCEEARQVALGYILGTPMCLQIAARGEYSVEDVVSVVEHAIGEMHGTSSIRAKMQAIVFKAQLGLEK